MVYERFTIKNENARLRKREIFSKTEQRRKVFSIKLKIPFLNYIKTFFYIFIIIFILYFLLMSPVFKIKQVEIENAKSTEISDYITKNLLGKNIIILFPGKFLKELTNEFPIIEEAQVVRGLPSSIRVSIKERKRLLVWCSGKCFELDIRGQAYQEIPRPSDKLVLNDRSNIEGEVGDQLVPDRFIDFYLKLIEELEQIGIGISDSFIDDTTFKLTVKTLDGYEIIFDTSGSLANQIDALKQIIEKNKTDIKEYVDLRVEGVGYIK